MAARCLDELGLYLTPVVVGERQRLFDPAGRRASFRLIERRELSNGVQYLVYRPNEPVG